MPHETLQRSRNFNTKIRNFANFECFTKFLCLENLELYGEDMSRIQGLYLGYGLQNWLRLQETSNLEVSFWRVPACSQLCEVQTQAKKELSRYMISVLSHHNLV